MKEITLQAIDIYQDQKAAVIARFPVTSAFLGSRFSSAN